MEAGSDTTPNVGLQPGSAITFARGTSYFARFLGGVMGVRNWWIGMAVLVALVAGKATAAEANPEDGKVVGGTYSNPYFKLTYPLPAGYGEGLDPAPPSIHGYYVLNTPARLDGPGPSILISAEDMFFALKPMSNAIAMETELRQSSANTAEFKADTPPVEVKIGGRSFARLKIGGDILSRVVLATDIRCHVVSITVASTDPKVLDEIAAGFDKITVPAEASATTNGSSEAPGAFPVCIKDYATPQTIVHKVNPPITSPKFLKIPVRVIIGKDGKVKHVHVIRAIDDDQQRFIEESLIKWEFKPYLVNGEPVEVETGLVFENDK
jgi:hypothetical protein